MTTMQALANRDIVLEIGATRTIAGVNVQVGNIKEGVSVRRRATERLNQHGNYSEAGKRGARLVTVDGIFWADTPAEAARAEDDLRAVLADGELGRLVKKTILGDRWANCYLFGTPDVALDTETDGEFSIDFECPDPRWYGDLVTLRTGVQKAGGGLQLDPAFGPSQTTAITVNQTTNPHPFAALGTWAYAVGTGEAGTTAYDVAAGQDGRPGVARRVITTAKTGGSTGWNYTENGFDGKAGDLKSAAMWLKAPNTHGARLRLQFMKNGTTVNFVDSPSATSLTAGVWTRIAVDGAIATGDYDRIYLWAYHTSGQTSTAGNYDAGQAVIASGPTAPVYYFDGGTPDVPGTGTAKQYLWGEETLPNASWSVETITTYGADAGGYLNFGAGGSPGTVTWTNTGKADVSPIFKASDAAGFTITEVETQRRIIYTGTVLAGQTIDIDANDGTVNLNGADDRSSELVLAQWPVIPGGATRTYMLESITPTATLEMQVHPAWW